NLRIPKNVRKFFREKWVNRIWALLIAREYREVVSSVSLTLLLPPREVPKCRSEWKGNRLSANTYAAWEESFPWGPEANSPPCLFRETPVENKGSGIRRNCT